MPVPISAPRGLRSVPIRISALWPLERRAVDKRGQAPTSTNPIQLTDSVSEPVPFYRLPQLKHRQLNETVPNKGTTPALSR